MKDDIRHLSLSLSFFLSAIIDNTNGGSKWPFALPNLTRTLRSNVGEGVRIVWLSVPIGIMCQGKEERPNGLSLL